MRNKNLRAIIITAIFAALSIVLGKFAAINIGDSIRISFENLPIMLTSFLFGPIYGAACGVVADVLGCVLRGYSMIPLITVASALMGIIPWLVLVILKKKNTIQIMIAGVVSHVVCSMLVKTFALHIVYNSPYSVLFSTRVPIYLATALLESYICVILMKRKFVQKEIMLKQ